MNQPELIDQFVDLTGATPQKAQSYLKVSDYNLDHAVALFFDTGGVDIEAHITTGASAPTRQTEASSQDDYNLDEDDDLRQAMMASQSNQQATSYEDDEAMARRLQEEFYASGGGSSSMGGNDVRAPLARTRETLIGPDIDEDYAPPSRVPRITRAGIFSQHTTVWDNGPPDALSPEERRRRLAAATGGASDKSTHAGRLAELFRPPVELISNMDLEDARDVARDQEKWVMVNVQDDGIFMSQVLNRDIWRAPEVQQCVKEHFIFLQMGRMGKAGRDYIRLYMPNVNAGIDDQFPHIAIIDPRTGEQVKVWKEMPKIPMEFVHTVIEFLDRYSLHEDAKNPVQRSAKPKPVNVEAMTEEEMLELAMQQSLDAGAVHTPRTQDPDELTRESTDLMDVEETSQSKGKEVAKTPFQLIAKDRHHAEPPQGAPNSTRIQFKLHDGSRVVRRFLLNDPVERLFEYVKADLLPEKGGNPNQEFDLVSMGKKLIEVLEQTVEQAGLKMGTVMVETIDE